MGNAEQNRGIFTAKNDRKATTMHENVTKGSDRKMHTTECNRKGEGDEDEGGGGGIRIRTRTMTRRTRTRTRTRTGDERQRTVTRFNSPAEAPMFNQ